jgi:hypothetical protein
MGRNRNGLRCSQAGENTHSGRVDRVLPAIARQFQSSAQHRVFSDRTAKNGSGKILKRVLRDAAWARQERAVALTPYIQTSTPERLADEPRLDLRYSEKVILILCGHARPRIGTASSAALGARR